MKKKASNAEKVYGLGCSAVEYINAAVNNLYEITEVCGQDSPIGDEVGEIMNDLELYEGRIEDINDAVRVQVEHTSGKRSAKVRRTADEKKGDHPFYIGRYLAILGPNSNQWWAYDCETEELVDPPVSVLDELDGYDYPDGQEDRFNEILNENPDWLYDDGYRYDGEMDI